MVKKPDSFGRDWALYQGKIPLIEDAKQNRLGKLKPLLPRLQNVLLERRSAALNAGLTSAAFRLLKRGAEAGHTQILLHPVFPLWISIAETMAAQDLKPDHPAWSALGAHLQEFAVSQSVILGAAYETAALSDHLGHIHLQGLSCYIDLGRERALKPVILRHKDGLLTAQILQEQSALRIPRTSLLKGLSARGLKWLPRVAGAIEIDSCNGLILNQNKITDHKIGLDTQGHFLTFQKKLEEALAQMRRLHPGAHTEILRLIRLIVPLQTPKGMTSASSTSREFPGALMLSHCDDALVQAETLVHEGSHAKLNLCLEKEVFLEEAGDALYYSPLKGFPRPIHYLLFAAHSFINVVDYLLRFWSAEKNRLEKQRLHDIELYAARRAYEVELELSACGQHARFTERGRLFYLACLQALGEQLKTISAFHPDNIREARLTVEKHRLEFSRYPSFLFKSPAQKTQNGSLNQPGQRRS